MRFSNEHSVAEVAADLAKLGEVSKVEYNRTLKRATEKKAVPLTKEKLQELAPRAGVFNDPLLSDQWHIVNDGNLRPTKFVEGADVNVEKAWELTTGDPSIIVAVLDEGVDVAHPDLKASMWVNEDEIWKSHEDNDGNGYAGDVHGYNFVRKHGVISTDDLYDTGHGSHVAGVIAAVNNNGVGISSIAGGNASQPGVKIMSCQIFSGMYAGTVLEEVRAIKYAADNGAVILQCSWGYISGAANPFEWTPQYSTDEEWEYYNVLERKALDYFIHNAGSPDGVIEGGLAIFAGGNEAAPAASYPGAYPDFVAVAATAGDFTPAVYSNYGPGTTISAPGGDQDYYWDYVDEDHRLGEIGCVLSTLPFHVSETGYGYMEGTSMACPHVSGVAALGLSYAAKLKKHFKAKDFIELLYQTATPIDQYMTGIKQYKKYIIGSTRNNLFHYILYLCKLVHKAHLVVQTACCVDDYHIGIICNSRRQCIKSNRCRVRAHTLLDDRHIGTVSPLYKLLNSSSTECIGSTKVHLLPGLLELVRKLTNSCCLTHTVNTYNHNYIWFSGTGRNIERIAVGSIVFHKKLRNLVLQQFVEFCCIHELVTRCTFLYTINDFQCCLDTDIRCHKHLFEVIEHFVIDFALAGNGTGNLSEHALLGL